MEFNNFSYSKVSEYITCPRKFKLRYVDRIVPRKKPKPLALGACIASGIAAFREGKSKEDCMYAFMKQWEKDGKTLDVLKADDPLRSTERGLEILASYINSHPDDPKMSVMPEVRFEEEVAPGVIWRGRLDGIFDVGNNEVAVIEDKTQSRWGDSYFASLQKSYQILSYLYIARHRGLFEIKGKQRPKIVLNIIYIHPIKYDWPRRVIEKFDQEVTAAWDELMSWVRQIKWAVENNHFPCADSDTCKKYGGCEYLPLKFAPKRTVESLVNAEFIRKNDEEEYEKQDVP